MGLEASGRILIFCFRRNERPLSSSELSTYSLSMSLSVR